MKLSSRRFEGAGRLPLQADFAPDYLRGVNFIYPSGRVQPPAAGCRRGPMNRKSLTAHRIMSLILRLTEKQRIEAYQESALHLARPQVPPPLAWR